MVYYYSPFMIITMIYCSPRACGLKLMLLYLLHTHMVLSIQFVRGGLFMFLLQQQQCGEQTLTQEHKKLPTIL